jgi:hypothetical protein
MTLSHQQKEASQQHLQRLRLQKKMQGLQNEMEFVEILVQFWPWQNMSDKMERLQSNLSEMQRQCLEFRGLSVDEAGSLPFSKVLLPNPQSG